jgi:hypothetical protein
MIWIATQWRGFRFALLGTRYGFLLTQVANGIFLRDFLRLF